MAKEKTLNPAQAQHKLDKQKALKKGKAEQAARRTEKLARRNPARLQRQIDELRGAEASGAALNTREKKQLEELERDLKAVLKAREALGDKAPTFGDGGGGGGARPAGALGKRRRDDDTGGGGGRGGGSDAMGGRGWPRGPRRHDGTAADDSDDSSSAPESVKNIPMPRDTPPPIPAEYFAAQQRKQQLRRQQQQQQRKYSPPPIRQQPHPLPQRPGLQAAAPPPARPAQTVYEAKPVLRDLRKEATSAFVPSAVRAKLDAAKGHGKKLLEPEDADALERQGYLQGSKSSGSSSGGAAGPDRQVARDRGDGGDDSVAPLPQSPPPPQPPSRRPLPTVEDADSDDDNDSYGPGHGHRHTTSSYGQSNGPSGGSKEGEKEEEVGDEDAFHLLDEEEKRFRRDMQTSPMDTG